MRAAAAELQFEVAARLRDEVSELKKELRQMREAGGCCLTAGRPGLRRGARTFAVLQDRHKSPLVRPEPWRQCIGFSKGRAYGAAMAAHPRRPRGIERRE
ncbi:hypothetical protein SANTM175S_08583 [Streptomyces antimycoticus]